MQKRLLNCLTRRFASSIDGKLTLVNPAPPSANSLFICPTKASILGHEKWKEEKSRSVLWRSGCGDWGVGIGMQNRLLRAAALDDRSVSNQRQLPKLLLVAIPREKPFCPVLVAQTIFRIHFRYDPFRKWTAVRILWTN